MVEFQHSESVSSNMAYTNFKSSKPLITLRNTVLSKTSAVDKADFFS